MLGAKKALGLAVFGVLALGPLKPSLRAFGTLYKIYFHFLATDPKCKGQRVVVDVLALTFLIVGDAF